MSGDTWTDADIASDTWTDADVAKPGSVLKRTLHGALDPLYGLAQIADKTIVDPIRQRIAPGSPNVTEAISQREADYTAPEGVDWARMGGNVISPVNLATLPLQASGRAASGAVGAASAMLEPTSAEGADFARDKIRQAATGAALGIVAPGLPVSKDARQLMRQGVQPTAGQAWGGAANQLEQAATSWPIVGSSIVHARTRPINEFGEQVLQRATGKPVKNLDEANAAVSDMYQSVAPHLPQHQLDPTFYSTFQKALNNPELTPTNQKLLYDLTGNRFANYEQLSGQQLKNLDSDIGSLVRKYRSSTDVSHHAIADGLQEIQQGMRQTWETLLPPELRGKLQEANAAYRSMVPINRAASTRADERIMPRPLQRALARAANTDVSRMPADTLVDPALRTLPGNLPDSGTPARLLATDIDTLTKAALAKIPAEVIMSRPMQRLLTGNTGLQQSGGLAAMLSAALRAKKENQNAE